MASVCPVALESCGFSALESFAVLLEARSFGEGAELVASSGESVLVRGGPVPWRVATLPDGWNGPGPLSVVELPSGRWNALALDDRRPFQGSLDVLACELDRGICLLLSDDEQAPALLELTGSTFASTFEAHALAGRCVLGRGIMCFRGAWQTVLDASLLEPDERIVLYTGELAGSSTGRLWRRRKSVDAGAQPDWQRDETLDTTKLGTLRGISTGWNGLALYGERGFLSVDPRIADSGTSFCSTDPLAAVFEAGRLLVTTSGEVLVGNPQRVPPSGWCRDPLPATFGPILDQTVSHCGLANNPRLLTATTLLATSFCIID